MKHEPLYPSVACEVHRDSWVRRSHVGHAMRFDRARLRRISRRNTLIAKAAAFVLLSLAYFVAMGVR